jgi:phage recombination protein Bet
MSTEIATVVTDNQLINYLDNLGLTSKLTKEEKNTYLQIAKAFGLNPFKREIHVSKYGDNLSIITGYEVYIKRAERSGQLDGWSATTTGSIAENNLKATVTIHRKDRKYPFVWEALYSECVQTTDVYENNKKTGQKRPTKFWEKAEFMTKKVAISQAFRLCFSDELGGMPYTADEMPPEEEVNLGYAQEIKAETPILWLTDEQFEKAKTSDKKGIQAVLKVYTTENKQMTAEQRTELETILKSL